MRGTGPMSFAVMTARTPAMASAAAASTAATWPCATGLRRMAACSMLTRFKSPTNWPRPRSKRASSIRSTGLPIHRFVPIMVCQPPGRQRALRALLRRSRYSWCCGTSCQTRAAREWLLGRARADDIGDHQEQVGVAGLLAGCGQHSVDLPTVMCLVVEEVGHQQPQRCADLAVGSPAEPGEVLGEPCVVDLVRPTRDTGIGLFALRTEHGEILDHAGPLLDRSTRPGPGVETRRAAASARDLTGVPRHHKAGGSFRRCIRPSCGCSPG